MKHTESFSDRLYNATEHFAELSQAVLGVMLFVCIIVEAVAWLFQGRINTLLGFIVTVAFLYLGWVFASTMVKSYKESKKKDENNE